MEYQFTFWQPSEIEQLVEVWTEGFSDYSIDMKISVGQMKEKIIHDRIDWNYCVGAKHGERFVGFIVHGSEKTESGIRIYNGGTGVVPMHRGNHLTQRMYHWLMQNRGEKIDEVILEVLDDNHKAIHVYKSLGFRQDRTMETVGGRLSGGLGNKDFLIIEDAEIDWVRWRRFWDIDPAWQSCPHPRREDQPALRLFLCQKNDSVVGYVLIHEEKKRILQMAVDPAHRHQGAGNALLDHLARLSDEKWWVINIDEKGEELLKLLKGRGMKHFIRQLEMSTRKFNF